MRTLPEGTVTLLFTDIESSTSLLERSRDSYAGLLARHHELVEGAIAASAGQVVNTAGDSFFAAFATAEAAVTAAVEVQRRLLAEPWPEHRRVLVRIGLHSGAPQRIGTSYVGLDVHRAARIMAAGHGGQILVSETTASLLGSAVALRDLGEHRLKDLSLPQRLYQVLATGIREEFPAVRTLENRPTNLPVQRNALLGREAELATLGAMLGSTDVRVVTVTGTGGVGKTRLTLEIAAGLVDQFPQGVYFVSLAVVRDPDLVLPTIAQTLGLTDDGTQLVSSRLSAALGGQVLLLVLDNFEQVLGGFKIREPRPAGPRLPAARSRLKFGRAHVDGLNVDSTPANAPDSGRNDAVALEPNALVDALLAQTGVGVTIVDRDLRVVRANRAFGVFGDRTPADVVGRSIADVLPLLASQIVPAMLAVLETGVPAIAHELVAPDANDPAQSKYFRTFRCPVVASDGSIVGVASTVIDITDLRNALAERDAAVARQREQAELNEYQATHDALTGLANRRKLYSDAAHALSEPGARSFALALFDLDGFKAYNDAFGHPAGDALLARLGHQIDDAIGGHGIAYRMGGDEFCVLTWAADPEQALEDARVALCCEGDGFSVRCSRGAALVPSQATTLEQALQFADERLYADKRANQVRDTQHARDALVQLVAEQRQLSPNIINLADLAAATATRLGLSPDDITCTRIAAALHDIGKTALPDAILNKAGPLDSDERAFVQRHAVIGERILTATPTLARIAPIVRASHERPDGKGYPDGLTVDGIPIGARIIAVVDAFDAMISPRPYKAPMSVTEAVAELRRCAGTQFDATVVQAFAHVIEEPRLELRAA